MTTTTAIMTSTVIITTITSSSSVGRDKSILQEGNPSVQPTAVQTCQSTWTVMLQLKQCNLWRSVNGIGSLNKEHYWKSEFVRSVSTSHRVIPCQPMSPPIFRGWHQSTLYNKCFRTLLQKFNVSEPYLSQCSCLAHY